MNFQARHGSQLLSNRIHKDRALIQRFLTGLPNRASPITQLGNGAVQDFAFLGKPGNMIELKMDVTQRTIGNWIGYEGAFGKMYS